MGKKYLPIHYLARRVRFFYLSIEGDGTNPSPLDIKVPVSAPKHCLQVQLLRYLRKEEYFQLQTPNYENRKPKRK